MTPRIYYWPHFEQGRPVHATAVPGTTSFFTCQSCNVLYLNQPFCISSILPRLFICSPTPSHLVSTTPKKYFFFFFLSFSRTQIPESWFALMLVAGTFGTFSGHTPTLVSQDTGTPDTSTWPSNHPPRLRDGRMGHGSGATDLKSKCACRPSLQIVVHCIRVSIPEANTSTSLFLILDNVGSFVTITIPISKQERKKQQRWNAIPRIADPLDASPIRP